MGERGPKRQSAEYHRLCGGNGEGRGFATPASVPRKPEWIAAKPIASRKWDETLEELQEIPGLLSRLDGDVLSLYADCWQTFHDAQQLILEHGYIAHSEKGGAYQHPSVGVCNKARESIIKIGSMFGLNPPAREGIVLRDVEDDELERLIQG